MSYFSTLPAGDHGNAMPGHWYSHSSAAPAVRLIIIINVGNGSPVLSLTPATRLCRFHFIIVITLCHNLLCLLLPPLPLPSSSSPPPPFAICTWYEQRRHYYYAISVPKTEPISLARHCCNLPTFLCHLCGKLLSWLSTSIQLLTDWTASTA